MKATRTSLHGNLPTLSRLRVRRDLADSLQMASSGLHERHFATVNFRTRSENRLNPCATRSNEPKSPHVSNALPIARAAHPLQISESEFEQTYLQNLCNILVQHIAEQPVQDFSHQYFLMSGTHRPNEALVAKMMEKRYPSPRDLATTAA